MRAFCRITIDRSDISTVQLFHVLSVIHVIGIYHTSSLLSIFKVRHAFLLLLVPLRGVAEFSFSFKLDPVDRILSIDWCKPFVSGAVCVAFPSPLTALAGSTFPITGTSAANICWKGRVTKCPRASNHCVNGLDIFTVFGTEGFDAL